MRHDDNGREWQAIIFCTKLSINIIFSSIPDIFHSFFPVLSSFFQFCPDKTGRNMFLPLFSGCPGRNMFLLEETQPWTTHQGYESFVPNEIDSEFSLSNTEL